MSRVFCLIWNATSYLIAFLGSKNYAKQHFLTYRFYI